MSLILNKKEKKNKTEDKSLYFKEYRKNNQEHIRNLERMKYYKNKYNLEPEFVSLFGEYSGDVFKIIKAFNDVTNKCPELASHIISKLQEKIE
jgi:hypothetical protein